MRASELIQKIAEQISNSGDRDVEIRLFVKEADLNGEESEEISDEVKGVQLDGYGKYDSIIISNLPF